MVCPLGSSKEQKHLVAFFTLRQISTIMCPLLRLSGISVISASVSVDHHFPHASKSHSRSYLYHFLGIFTQVLNSISQKSALISINSHLSNVCSAPSPALDPQNPLLLRLVTSCLGPATPPWAGISCPRLGYVVTEP